jgi:hypothetical protein
VRVSTKPRNGRRLKLIGATALGLDALLFLGGAVVVAAVEGFDGSIFVPLVVMCILGFFGWLGLRSPGRAAGCLLPLAFIGFCFWALGAALSGVSLAWFLLFLILWSFIPLIAAILFLIARRAEGPSQPRRYVNDSADLW